MADLDLGIDDAHSGHFLDSEEFGTSVTQRRRRGLTLEGNRTGSAASGAKGGHSPPKTLCEKTLRVAEDAAIELAGDGRVAVASPGDVANRLGAAGLSGRDGCRALRRGGESSLGPN